MCHGEEYHSREREGRERRLRWERRRERGMADAQALEATFLSTLGYIPDDVRRALESIKRWKDPQYPEAQDEQLVEVVA